MATYSAHEQRRLDLASGAELDRNAELLRLAAEVEFARTHGLTALAAKEERAIDRDFARWEATLRSAA